MERRLSALVLASALSILASACGTSPPATTTSATARATAGATSPDKPSSGTSTKASTRDVPSEVIAKVCSAPYTDEGSKVFVAFKAGAPHRLVVTPSRNIPDKGNLVFDLQGNHLGGQTGGEFPWEDKALMEKEHARVEALMDGATEDESPIACR